MKLLIRESLMIKKKNSVRNGFNNVATAGGHKCLKSNTDEITMNR